MRVVKSNRHYTRVITPKRVTSDGAYFRGLALGQHSSKETPKQWRAVSDTVSEMTGPGFEPQTCCTGKNALPNELTGQFAKEKLSQQK